MGGQGASEAAGVDAQLPTVGHRGLSELCRLSPGSSPSRGEQWSIYSASPACHWWRAAHGSLVPQHFRPALECEPFRFLFPRTQPSGREPPGCGGKKGGDVPGVRAGTVSAPEEQL